MLGEPTPEAELAVRAALVGYSKKQWPQVVFLRLHAKHPATDLLPLLQTVTYDRTVVIDVSKPADEYLASLSKKFRYTVRQALKHDDIVVADETEEATADFGELHAIYAETAERDGFGIFDAEVYRGMLEALAPHARVFVARRTGPNDERGRAIAWAIVTDYDGAANYVYAGANGEARELDATVRLLWDVLGSCAPRASARSTWAASTPSSRRASRASASSNASGGRKATIDPAWDVPVKPEHVRACSRGCCAPRSS